MHLWFFPNQFESSGLIALTRRIGAIRIPIGVALILQTRAGVLLVGHKKVRMNVNGTSQVETEALNVVPLFGRRETDLGPDPLSEILTMGEILEDSLAVSPVINQNRVLVSANQFPDQSMFVLDKQLAGLKESLGRLKFYLNEVDDLLPR